MPVIRIQVDQSLLSRPDDALGAVIAAVSDCCTGLLRAAPEHVQIMVLPVWRVGAGARVYVECQFRAQPWRTPDCLDGVMAAIEQAVMRAWDEVPRIRCFSLSAATLSARN